MAIIALDGVLKKNLLDSGADPFLKILDGDASPFQDGIHNKVKAGGESRFGINKDDVWYFYYNFECPEFFFYTKSDLIQYLEYSKEEFYNPTQNYGNKYYLKEIYDRLYSEIISYKEEYITLKMYGKFDYGSDFEKRDSRGLPSTTRAYLEFFTRRDNDNYNRFRKILLPESYINNKPFTSIYYYRFLDVDNNKMYIYMKPVFTKSYNAKELAELLTAECKPYLEANPNADVTAVINLFGIKYAERIKHVEISDIIDDIDSTIIDSLSIRNANADMLDKREKACNILRTALTSYDLIKGKCILQNPYANVSLNNLSKTIEETQKVEIDNDYIPKEETKQEIYYGAPGTGKSNSLRGLENAYRITFHPDTDYAGFVGCYKPSMEKDENGEEKIVYAFIPQAFTLAIVDAWNNIGKKTINLIIEEINRGNCAQIFGDIFQLLDRDEDGFSTYPINVDKDLWNYLSSGNLPSNYEEYITKLYTTKNGKVFDGRKKLALPPNLNIYATMNTSDQSLFPIDSAFKRRWNWKYMKIKNEHKDWKIDVDLKSKDDNGNEITKKVDWWEFIDKINKIIASMTSSADKQMGYFFCKATEKETGNNEPTIITKETFVSKVIFYLWNDVFKDYGFEDASLFQYKDIEGKVNDLTFPDFYKENSNEVNPAMVTDFVQKVMSWKKKEEEKS